MTDQEHYDYVIRRHSDFAEERKGLISTLLNVTERFDKWVIGLPAGGIGVSILFYEKIVAATKHSDLTLLGYVWMFFALGVALGFASLYLSTRAVSRQITITDEDHQRFINTSTPDKPEGSKRRLALQNPWGFWTELANITGALCSIFGIALFLFFCPKPSIQDHRRSSTKTT